MSLYDIFVQRAALEHQNALVSDNTGMVLQSLAEGVAKGISEEQARVQKQRDAEREAKTAMEQFKAVGGDSSGMKRKISYGSDGKMTVTLEDTSVDDLKAKRENRIANQAELSNATRLRGEFINRPEVKDFVTVNTSVNAMEALLNRAMETKDKNNYVATDQGLITMYNKLTDPQSVVRESEYARTPENLPMVNRMIGAIGKIQAGGAGLTDDDRKALVEGAKVILKERANPYNEALGEYSTLAEQYGLDPSMVTRGMKQFDPSIVKSVGVSVGGEQKSFKKGRFQIEVE
jgi:hypothetical protein